VRRKLPLLALASLLALIAASRQEFIGDGVRHLGHAIASDVPGIGSPRWLLFPALSWLLVHPLAVGGLVTGTEGAIRVMLVFSVVAGVAYLWSVERWLRAEGASANSRAAALLAAGSAIPFLTLYSDIAEVQIPASLVVFALAMCRARFAANRGGHATILFTVAAIALASLVYQALALALLFVPLVAPIKLMLRPKVFVSAAALVMCVPAAMILGRMAAGDVSHVAVLTTFLGEQDALVRSWMARAAPLKWAAALVAGPPQAIVGLWKFHGLPALATGLAGGDPDAIVNSVRLGIALVIGATLGWAIVRTRDWRLIVAAASIVVVPVIRNQQYTYSKFFVLWPLVIALAAVKLRPRAAAAIAAVMLVLNTSLIARQVLEGRARYSGVLEAYRTATTEDCFFTSDWGPPFGHRWPGSSVALISIFWATGEDGVTGERVEAALEDCFCRSRRVWTDTTAQAAGDVARLADHFQYRVVPLADFPAREGDGSAVAATPAHMFVYSATRKRELCAVARR
jgi:hypothetical protein